MVIYAGFFFFRMTLSSSVTKSWRWMWQPTSVICLIEWKTALTSLPPTRPFYSTRFLAQGLPLLCPRIQRCWLPLLECLRPGRQPVAAVFSSCLVQLGTPLTSWSQMTWAELSTSVLRSQSCSGWGKQRTAVGRKPGHKPVVTHVQWCRTLIQSCARKMEGNKVPSSSHPSVKQIVWW